MKTTLEELEKEEGVIKNELKIAKQNVQILERQKKELMRRQRTHRLCNHGGLLERFLPPDQFSDEQIKSILKELFQKPETKELLERIKNDAPDGVSLE